MPQRQHPNSISNGMMKKILLSSIFFLFIGLVPHVFAAQDFVPLAPIPGLTEGGAATSGNLAEFFNNLYKYLIGLAAILAIIEIIWGGLEYSTQDSVSSKSNAKERIYNAIGGLILVLSPVLVFSIINPSILNLSLSLPELDLTAPAVNYGTPKPVADATSSNGSAFKLYTCSDDGNCDAAITSCKNDGGISGQTYCINSNNQIIPNGKKILGGLLGGSGCSQGLALAIKCVGTTQSISF